MYHKANFSLVLIYALNIEENFYFTKKKVLICLINDLNSIFSVIKK
jgi:hypothetical protein